MDPRCLRLDYEDIPSTPADDCNRHHVLHSHCHLATTALDLQHQIGRLVLVTDRGVPAEIDFFAVRKKFRHNRSLTQEENAERMRLLKKWRDEIDDAMLMCAEMRSKQREMVWMRAQADA
jgi:hypothetical protein